VADGRGGWGYDATVAAWTSVEWWHGVPTRMAMRHDGCFVSAVEKNAGLGAGRLAHPADLRIGSAGDDSQRLAARSLRFYFLGERPCVEDFSMMKTQKLLIVIGTAFAMVPLMAADCLGSATCTVDTDCLAGEICNNPNGTDGGGTCIPGSEGEGEGEGEEPTCPGGAISDGACLEDRPDGTDPSLCDGTNCVDPGSLVGSCTAAQGHTDEGGPVLYDLGAPNSGNASDACDDYTIYGVSVYSEVAFETSLYSQRIKFIQSQGDDAELTFSDPPDVTPSVLALDGLPGYYELTFYLCGTGSGSAIFLSNDNGVDGNAICIP
jgi:hypothetical protein